MGKVTSTSATAVTAQPKRRDRIIDVAIRLFTTTEYEDVSVEEICRQADVAKGLVFYHFRDKRGLFAAAAERISNEMVTFQQPSPSENTPTLLMYGFLRRHFEYVRMYPQRFSLLMMADRANAEVRDTVVEIRRRAVSVMFTSLGCPVNPPPRLRQAIQGYLGFVDTVTIDWLAHLDTEVDEVVDLCVQSLVAAVRAANGRLFDVETELEALAQVSLTSEKRGRPDTGAPARRSRSTRPVAGAPG